MPRNFGLAKRRSVPAVDDHAFATWAIMGAVALIIVASLVF